jgi:Lrp/AsnC family leucine-responsive transcriptional regulator
VVELLDLNELVLDDVDRQILERLMREGRATWADLAEAVGLTAPAIAQRVHRLSERGVIKQFAAIVAAEVVAPVTAYVTLTVGRPERRAELARAIGALAAVQECVRLAGAEDYLLKVRAGSLADLDEVVAALGKLPGVVHVRASVVLANVKDSPIVPFPDPRPGKAR